MTRGYGPFRFFFAAICLAHGAQALATSWIGSGAPGESRVQYTLEVPVMSMGLAAEHTATDALAYGLAIESAGKFYPDPGSALTFRPSLAWRVAMGSFASVRLFGGPVVVNHVGGLWSAYPQAGAVASAKVWGPLHLDAAVDFAFSASDFEIAPSMAVRMEWTRVFFRIEMAYVAHRYFVSGLPGEVITALVPTVALGVNL